MRYLKIADAAFAAYNPLDRKPRVVNFSVIETCNARCTMCNIWKSNDGTNISSRSLEALSSPFFNRVTHVGLSGGEPFLREDLDQIINTLVTVLPRLGTVSITSHGFNVERIKRGLPLLKKISDGLGIALSINFSIDGDPRAHDSQRGIPGGFAKTAASIQIAKDIGVPASLQFTATKDNVYTMPYVADLGRRLNLPVSYRLATQISRLDNQGQGGAFQITQGQKSFFADFITSNNTLRSSSLGKRLFYRKLARQVLSEDQRRTNPCTFQKNGIFIGGHGKIHPCSVGGDAIDDLTSLNQPTSGLIKRAQQALVSEVCATCVHDQTGVHKMSEYLIEWFDQKMNIRKLGHKALLCASLLPIFRRSFRASLRDSPLPADCRILAIGQYGGEHVGDAAILGGVISHESVIGRKIDVLSIRPDRTRMWLSQLKNTSYVNVVALQDAITQIHHYDLIIYAGGPIMDLPSILAIHLSLLNRRRRDTPFIIMGAGYIEFKSRISKLLGRRLMLSSSDVTVRSEKSRVALLKDYGIVSSVIQDPAITYLKSIYEEDPPQRISETKKCLINLRPLWNRYISADAALDINQEKTRLLEVIAEAVNSFAERYPNKVLFEFFAFNADQFGMSDFDMGIALAERIHPTANFSVNYNEFGVEDMTRALTQIDFAICMRLHACAFTLTRGIPTLGIEYASGFGKVAQLFEELAISEKCFNFCTISSADIVSFLETAMRGANKVSPDAQEDTVAERISNNFNRPKA